MCSLYKKIFVGFTLLTIGLSSQTFPISEYSGSSRDLELIESIKSNGVQYSSDRSVLWVERDYLSKREANLLQQKIDKGIFEIENFIGIQFDTKAYKNDKIEYFVHSRREASHTITTYHPRKYMFPVIFLTWADEKKAPYIHETVHIIAWDWNTLWIKEGLAVFLNDKLGGYPSFPNFGKDLDKLARTNLRFSFTLGIVGRNGIPKFSDRKERRLFYIFSGSFVKFLYERIGIQKLMEIYKAKNTEKAIAEITGKELDIWKKEWIDSIKKSY